MSNEGDAERCARCGAEFAATSSPLGLCPACLLKLGMSDPAMAAPAEPEPEPVAPLAPVPQPAIAGRFRLQSQHVWTMGAVVVVIAVLTFASSIFVQPRRQSAVTHANPVRFTLTLPDETAMLDGAQIALSSDGLQLVVAARSANGQQRLWLRRLQSLEWRELPRTDGATLPFWSPDSRHVGFFTNRSLKRIDVGNDLLQTVCDVTSGRGGTWNDQNVIVFANANGLSRVPASGGTPVAVTKVDVAHGHLAHLWPQFLPGGRRFVFLVRHANGKSETHVGEIDGAATGAGTVAIAEGRGPTAFAGNVLLFSRGETLATQEFDQSQGSLIGEAQTLGGVENIAGSMTTGAAFSASTTVLVYKPYVAPQRQLTWFGREGQHLGVLGGPAEYSGIALSPNGRSLAVARRDDNNRSSIWLMDVLYDRISRLTAGLDGGTFPLWSPDGSRIAFTARRDEIESVHTILASGGAKDEVLFKSPEPKHLTDWSQDGRYLIYTARSARTGLDLWMLPTMGDHKPQPLEQTPANESQGRLSPDTRWIAYVSDQSGAEEVYLRAFPPSDGQWQISTGGGTRPRWRADGREIYFLAADGRLMAAEITVTPSPQFGVPQPILALRGADDFVVGRDGRFLVELPVEETGDRQLHVVLNWASELSR